MTDNKTTCAAAADLLAVDESEIVRFDDTPDLFNPPNTLGGWLCRRSDHRYGALVIDMVSGSSVTPQTVYGTPKQHYPFGRTENEDRAYHWPKAIKQCVAFEKFDGTNILGYCYTDGETWWTTFKTRLTATLRASSTHGDFFGLWEEVLADKLAEDGFEHGEGIYDFISPRTAASFELYGHRNHHLISYEDPLSAVWLFSVDQATGALRPPEFNLGLKVPKILAVATARMHLTEFYEDIRAKSQERNKAIDDAHLEGTEGAVLYVQSEGGAWSQWKCKH